VNYYEHHIGDYDASTAHLSLVEDAIYSRMLRRYYRQEGPLPVQVEEVARLIRARDEIETVRAILLEFFKLADDGWHKKRCDDDIAKFREKQAKASSNAKTRWANVKPECERNADALPTHSERNAHQTPDTSLQTPVKTRAGAPAAGSRLPTDWTPPADWLSWAQTERPEIDAKAEAAKFADYWHAQAGAKGRKADWQATWRNWIRNAFAPRSHGPPASVKPSAAADFRGKTYDATPIDQLPPDLRDAAERALRDG
jgi:uncharacterized protein YdaU (DUF1376 family)